MGKRNNWQEFQVILEQHRIKKLYHFTDRENLQSIINNGGLYSWADCEEKGITIAKPGGGNPSRKLDKKHGLEHYVRLSFTKRHPMMFVAKDDGRINDPVILEINPEILYEEDTLFSDKNAASNDAHVGGTLDDFKKIHFKSVTASKHFDLEESEQPYFQAEILVKNFVPLKYIANIESFGIPIKRPNLDEKTLTTDETKEDLENGVEDEYGAIYSSDGKSLLKGPDDLIDYTVKDGTTIIADKAFYHCDRLMSISFPTTISLIGAEAFSSCDALQSISLPQGVTHIGEGAFRCCRALQSISLPHSMTHIVDDAFESCEALQSISLPKGVTHIGNGAFSRCFSLQSISLPQGVTHIGNSAFVECKSIRSISLPEGLTHLGFGAFNSCESLKYASLPQSLTIIPSYAFAFCKSLFSISLSKNLTRIGDFAFRGCSSLMFFTFPPKLSFIGEFAFDECRNLTTIYLSNVANVSQASDVAFGYYGGSLLEIIIPSGTKKEFEEVLGINLKKLLSEGELYNKDGYGCPTKEMGERINQEMRKKYPNARAAFEMAGNRKIRPRATQDVPFCKGDIFTVPSTQEDPHWISKPMLKGGDAFLQLQIVLPREGSSKIVDISTATLFNCGTTIDGSHFETVTRLKDGSTCKDVAKVNKTDGEFWKALFGKTFIIVSVKDVKVRIRLIHDSQSFRIVNRKVFLIDEV